jgi:hypothetical protein
VVVSVDSAFTAKENDPTGCTTWGVWTDLTDGYPKVMLIVAWRQPPDSGEGGLSAFALLKHNT